MADYIESFKEHLINCDTHFEGDQIEAAGDVLNDSPIITKASAYDLMKPVYEQLVNACNDYICNIDFVKVYPESENLQKVLKYGIKKVLAKVDQLEKEE